MDPWLGAKSGSTFFFFKTCHGGVAEFHTHRIGEYWWAPHPSHWGMRWVCGTLLLRDLSKPLPNNLAEESSASHPWEELSPAAPAWCGPVLHWWWRPLHDRLRRARSWHRRRSRGLCLSSLTPQRLVRMIWSSLLEKQNVNNEVPLTSSCGPHEPFSSEYLRHFSRYSIVLNRFTLNPGRSISRKD